MAENTKIEWADHTFNPWTGCTKVSPGCDHCYAEGWAKRSGTVQWGDAPRRRTTEANWRLPLKWNAQAEREGRRFRVFCASLADVFDNAAPPAWRADLMSMVVRTPHLDWLMLTKRIGNAKRMLSDASMHDGLLLTANDEYRPPANLWIGATVVTQAEADRDIPKLLAVPAAKRFLSIEPLLGTIDLGLCDCDQGSVAGPGGAGGVTCPKCSGTGGRTLDWIIVGGESGPGARPMHPDWVRSIRDQCEAVGVPFLFKQWGEHVDFEHIETAWWNSRTDAERKRIKQQFVSGKAMVCVGKHAAGRLLDGRTHDGFPATQDAKEPSDA